MSFRLKTIIGIALIEAMLLLVLIWTGINYLRTSSEEELIKRASSTLTLLLRASRDAVLSNDLATLEDLVLEAIKMPELDYVRILDGRSRVLAEARNSSHLDLPFSEDLSYEKVDDGVFDSAIDITESNSHYGRIEIGLATGHIENIISAAIKNASAIALLEMALVALFSLALGTYLTRQLYSLTQAANRIASGDIGHQVDILGSDELAQTAKAFNHMSRELKLDKEKQHAILRSSLDSIISMDADGRIIEFNKAAEAAFGYRREEIIGKPMMDMIIPPRLHESHRQGMAHYLETGEGPIMDQRVQVSAMRASGEEFPVELAVTAVDIDNKKLFIAYMRDITERIENENIMKQAKEAAEAAAEAKTRFLASMSHEVRTPLNSLLGFLGLLNEQQNMTAEQLTWIRTAQQSGASLLHLINETLDFSKIEAGKMELEQHDFDLRELVNDTVDTLAVQAGEKAVGLDAEIDTAVPAFIREDTGRLRQVLLNLLGNAIKFTDTGSIRLSVGVCEHDSLPHLHFEVTDTGRGIADTARESIFCEFTQLPQSGKPVSGSGLGLPISKRLVELMGGRLDFESKENLGSRFWFEIPLHTGERQAPATGPEKLDQPPARLKGRILLADDSEANKMVANAMLRESGCTVDNVNNGLEAVEAVRTLPYDLVLMDISMPKMDGLEATSAIRKLPGSKGAIPIVAMTAHAIVGDRENFIHAGMNDYISKPVTKHRLYEILKQWLPREQSEMSNEAQASEQTAQSPVLDTRVFEQLARDTSVEIVPKMLAAFCRETHSRIEILRQISAHGTTDFKQLQHEAHTLKSSAATFGATELNQIAAAAELACRNGDFENASGMLDALIDSGKRALQAIERHLASTASSDEQTTAASP
ncbi:MAG: PAS domain S-box protein [Gammaproteobacteria bacterium]|nr:PAS domain S-box protein [Gammaproteobacteria bacterium]